MPNRQTAETDRRKPWGMTMHSATEVDAGQVKVKSREAKHKAQQQRKRQNVDKLNLLSTERKEPMKKKLNFGKRGIAVIMTILMCITMMPATAFAADSAEVPADNNGEQNVISSNIAENAGLEETQDAKQEDDKENKSEKNNG